MLLDRHGVAVAPGRFFESPAHFRVSLAGEPERRSSAGCEQRSGIRASRSRRNLMSVTFDFTASWNIASRCSADWRSASSASGAARRAVRARGSPASGRSRCSAFVAGLSGWLWTAGLTGPAVVLLAGLGALVVVAYQAASRTDVDGTTEVAAFVVLAAGVLAGAGSGRLASGIIAITVLLLVEKRQLHRLVAQARCG